MCDYVNISIAMCHIECFNLILLIACVHVIHSMCVCIQRTLSQETDVQPTCFYYLSPPLFVQIDNVVYNVLLMGVCEIFMICWFTNIMEEAHYLNNADKSPEISPVTLANIHFSLLVTSLDMLGCVHFQFPPTEIKHHLKPVVHKECIILFIMC